MMKYTLTRRKKSVKAVDDVEFVSWMRQNDLHLCRDNKAFMELYAYRKRTFEKIVLRYDNEIQFVEDLKKNNLLTVEQKTGGIFNIFRK